MTTTEESAHGSHGADGVRLAEEIRLLVDMVVDRAVPWLDSLVDAGHGHGHGVRTDNAPGGPSRPDAGDSAEPGPGEHDPAGPDPAARAEDTGPEWCPLCAIVALWRGERTEVAVRVLDHAAQLLSLLRAVLADRWAPQDGVHMPGFRPPPREPDRPGAPARDRRVQRVVVRPRSQWETGARDRD